MPLALRSPVWVILATLRRRSPQTTKGFSLLETVVAMVIIMILGGIAAPGFLRFQDQRRVNQAQYLVYQALRSTQREAMEKRQQQQFSLRDRQGQLEWAHHPTSVGPSQVKLWQPLTPGVSLAKEDNTLTLKEGVYYVHFDFRGDVKTRLGTITLVGSGGRLSHRCVIVSTLIGALRQGEGHNKANGDRYCY